MNIKFENARLSVSQTKNPLFFQLGIHVDQKKAQENGLTHEGMAFCLVSKDEFKALMGVGFKPFSLATFSGEFREEENAKPGRPTLLKFDLVDFKFTGGMGSWDTVLEAPPPAAKEETTPVKDI
jgi:hypothetical protein